MEQGPIDELMRQHFLKLGESMEPKWWEGLRWGMKSAFLLCAALPHDDMVRQVLNTLEGQSEMAKRRQRWCEELQAEKTAKSPVKILKFPKRKKVERRRPDPKKAV
jgi:hypothetical protein